MSNKGAGHPAIQFTFLCTFLDLHFFNLQFLMCIFLITFRIYIYIHIYSCGAARTAFATASVAMCCVCYCECRVGSERLQETFPTHSRVVPSISGKWTSFGCTLTRLSCLRELPEELRTALSSNGLDDPRGLAHERISWKELAYFRPTEPTARKRLTRKRKNTDALLDPADTTRHTHTHLCSHTNRWPQHVPVYPRVFRCTLL